MAWQRAGTVSVAHGSTTVTGVGTAFTLCNLGDAIVFDGDATQTQYEITGPQTNNLLTSNTALVINPAYAGTTISGGTYKVVPLQPAGAPATLANRVASLIGTVNGYLGGVLSGLFGDGTTVNPAIAFAAETTTGLRRAAAGVLALVLQGVDTLQISANCISMGTAQSAWGSQFRALQLNQWTGLAGSGNGGLTYLTRNLYVDAAGAYHYVATGAPGTSYTQNSGIHSWYTVAGGTADAVVIPALGMSLTSPGFLRQALPTATDGQQTTSIEGPTPFVTMFYGTGALASGTFACVKINTISSTGRSLNLGGTVVSGGNDYAEYRQLIPALYGAIPNTVVPAGALLGYDATGLMTNVHADIVGRVLPKTTSPSAVGGDSWGTEANICAVYGVADPGSSTLADGTTDPAYAGRQAAFAAALETERVKWDRIALCGVVPVNVTGLTTADVGKTLVPEAATDGTITAAARNLRTEVQAVITANESPQLTALAQAFLAYMDGFGTIEKIGSDGRPLVNVKNG